MKKQYTIGKDGALALVDSPCLKGWIPVTKLDDLLTYEEKELDKERYAPIKWVGEKFPAELMKRVLGTIHEFPHTEVAFSLYYSTQQREWRVKCPEQYGGGASVSYEDDGEGMPPGFAIIGSIHTHPEMSAFWSGTDLNDQKFKHGIHFVFGLRGGLVDQWKCTVFMPNSQQDQEIWDVVEQFELKHVYDPDPDWVAIIKKQSYRRPLPAATTVYGGSCSYKYYGGHTSYNHGKFPKNHYGHAESTGRNYTKYQYTRDFWEDNWGEEFEYNPKYFGDFTKPCGDKYETSDNKFTTLIQNSLEVDGGFTDLRDASLDPELRGTIEQELDITIADTSDKADCIESILEIAASMEASKTETLTDEEASQLVNAITAINPYASLIDSEAAPEENIEGAQRLGWLIEGAVDAYARQKDCLSAESLSIILNALKDAYETILSIQAGEIPEAEEQ